MRTVSRGRRVTAAAFLLATAIAAFLAPPTLRAADAAIKGRASVIDGDTIEITGQRIRLHGIDAPESSQWCEDEAGERYRCGRDAAFFLDAMLKGRAALCDHMDTDRYGRIIGRCYFNDADHGLVDVNATMVHMGHAIAYRRYSRDFVANEEDARKARRGIWRGRFQAPWDWRRANR